MKRMLDERGLPCRAVVLTGGASHMPFVTEIAQRVFEGCAVVREQNPSITVARGLSIIGDTDLRAPQLLDERTVCRAMLQSPRLTAAQTLKNLASNR